MVMIVSSTKHNRKLDFELQSLHVVERRNSIFVCSVHVLFCECCSISAMPKDESKH